MGREPINLLLVYILVVVCTCKSLDGTTTSVEPRVQKVEDLESQVAELQQIVQSYMAKLDSLEDVVNNSKHFTGPEAAGPPGPPGKDGRDGEDGQEGPPGRDGRDGQDGQEGPPGRDGRDGEDGQEGPIGRDGRDGEDGKAGPPGRDGRNGRDGPQGLPGNDGNPGSLGAKGDVGPTGPEAGGATYTRWGRTSCGADATLVYAGFIGKSVWNQVGGGINYQCMVNDAEYNSAGVAGYYGNVAGTEYDTKDFGIFENEAFNQNGPCAVCYVHSRTSTLMVPGKRSCPTSWTMEYEGYLMSAHYTHANPSTYECVDKDPEYVRGEAADIIGGQLCFNRAVCALGVPCPEYDGNRAITCVVCTQ